ncbi:MAG: DHH family phosphoesterase [archaeon]
MNGGGEGAGVLRDETGFFAALADLAKEVKSRDDFVVVHHYDADGLTSGAITIKALEREGKKVKSVCLKQIYRENVAEIKGLGKNYLFVDFGSGQLDYLIDEFGDSFFILDHHQQAQLSVEQELKLARMNCRQINPHLFGINGGTEISGAGVAIFFALALNPNNSDLSALAIVGAVGDMQDSRGKLEGMNRKIIDVAVGAGLLETKIDLRLFGRISRPLVSFLTFSSTPVLPKLTAFEDNCRLFLQQNGIPLQDPFTNAWLSYEDLTPEQKRTLSSALIMHLSSFDVPEWKIQELVGEIYTLKKEKEKSPLRDAKEFATMLNACGRHARPEVGLAVCMGDRNVDSEYGSALALMAEHRAALAKGIQFIHEHGIEERKSFYFFDAGSEIQDSLVGIIAGMLYGSVIQENKPIIALARNEDGTVKASGRGTSYLVRRGLNIGGALKEISSEMQGVEGGGHYIAAGAKINADKLDEFLDRLEKKFAQQIGEK